jgi:signal transduction histidine kinase
MEKKIRILIAEDSPTQAQKLKYLLHDEGFITDIAKDGEQALEKIPIFNPAIVISDIMMPKMNGYELCKRIKSDAHSKDIPVILLTSLSDPEDVIKGLECGADNFLTKPYNIDFLLSRIKNIVVNIDMRSSRHTDMGIEVYFSGKKHFINSDRLQILDLLLSTYENAIQKNNELEKVNNELISARVELEKKNRDLEFLNDQKNQLLGMAAHDIRNPVGAILGLSEFLLEDDKKRLSDEQKDIIQAINDSSQFMHGLIKDILDISVIESGKLKLEKKKTNLAEFIKRCINLNSFYAEKKNIKLIFEFEENIPDIDIDPSKMEQLLNNLISNAIKFSHNNKRIRINLKKEADKEVLISVKDEGQGIPEKEKEKLFKPFEKLSVRGTAGESSTGLGLAITRKIAEGHGGKIRAESTVGKGSTFYVTLPV